MLKSQVKIGSHYAIRHHEDSRINLTVVKLVSPNQYGGYNAIKLKTGRTIRIKSAAKLRFEVTLNPDWQQGKPVQKWIKVS